MAEIKEAARQFKEDLQREGNRYVRQRRTDDAIDCLDGLEYVDRFVYQLQMRAGSQLHTLFEKRTRGKKPVHISDKVKEYAEKLEGR
jgi:hypothetical protein